MEDDEIKDGGTFPDVEVTAKDLSWQRWVFLTGVLAVFAFIYLKEE